MTSRPSFPQRVVGRIGRNLRRLGPIRSLRLKKLGRKELMERLLELRQGLLSEFQFENRDLSHLDLNGLVAERLNFVGCRFRGTNLDGSDLNSVRLVDCECRGMTAIGASWTDLTLEGCDLTEADLSSVTLTGSCPGVTLNGSLLTTR